MRPIGVATIVGGVLGLVLAPFMVMVLMFTGAVGLLREIKTRTGHVQPRSLWLVVAGLCLVIVGDAIHTLTWHQNGLTTPTPGTNPIANTAYAVHMMGMNFVIVGTFATGVIGLRKRILVPWLAWLFLMVAPSAVLMSVTLLPTTPSGALALFSVGMIALGYSFAVGKPVLASRAA